MIKYIATKASGDVFKANFEEYTVERVNYDSNIDYTYVIYEDGEWIVDNNKLFDVNKGDIIIRMYSASEVWENKEYIKLSSPELIDYYERLKAYRESRDKDLEKNCCDCKCACVKEA